MIAAAIDAGDALERNREVAVLLRDHRDQLVDLFRRVRWRLDLHPAADAIENSLRIEPIGADHERICAFESHHRGRRASKRGHK
ncbi:hypothetical protein ACVWZW_008552 [Bradyrhizobium sp. F1.13.4]